MKKVPVLSIPVDSILAEPIYSENGITLLGKGVQLTEEYISRLEIMGVDAVCIEDDIIGTGSHIIDNEQRGSEAERAVSHMAHHPQLTEQRKIHQTFHRVLDHIMSQKEVLQLLDKLQKVDSNLLHHSINTAVLSIIVGVSLGYEEELLNQCGIGALLFDVGMMDIPEEIRKKKTCLTKEEFQLIQNHPINGYKALKSLDNIPDLAAEVVLQHHERFNGTGYPYGKKAQEINEFARIIAIADVYDALTSNRDHRARYTPQEALEFIFANGNNLFDLRLIQHFIKHIAIYPIGTTLCLSTNQIGIVTKVHAEAMYRPTLKILKEANGEIPRPPYELDLRKELNIVVKSEICCKL